MRQADKTCLFNALSITLITIVISRFCVEACTKLLKFHFFKFVVDLHSCTSLFFAGAICAEYNIENFEPHKSWPSNQ